MFISLLHLELVHVLCVLLQLLWAPVCCLSCCVFPPPLPKDLLALGRGHGIDVLFKAVHSADSYSLLLSQIWVCVHRHLGWVLKDTLIYRYNDKSLEINLIICHSSRVIVAGSPQGPRPMAPAVSASPETRGNPNSGPRSYADKHSTPRASFPAWELRSRWKYSVSDKTPHLEMN